MITIMHNFIFCIACSVWRQTNSGVIHEVEGHKAGWKTNQYQMEARDSVSLICYPNINISTSNLQLYLFSVTFCGLYYNSIKKHL